MPYHIFINRESGNDNISIFYDEPTFVLSIETLQQNRNMSSQCL